MFIADAYNTYTHNLLCAFVLKEKLSRYNVIGLLLGITGAIG